MKSEKEFSKFAKPRLEFFWTIESFEGNGNQATPDWYLVHPTLGYSIWVELKIVKAGRVEFQPGQCQWLERHSNKGGLAFVLLLSPGLSGEKGGVVSLYPAAAARWLSGASLCGREGLESVLSRSLLPALPLLSPGVWESVGRSLWEAADGREVARGVAREEREGGEDLGG